MSSSVIFRSYTPADHEVLPDLFMRAIRSADPALRDGPWIDDLRNPEEEYGNGGDIIVGELGSRLVAMGGLKRLDDDTVEMKRVGVEPGIQKQGVGRQLLHALEDRTRELGAAKIVLDTPHAVAKLLYRHEGYIETGVKTIDHPSGITYSVHFFKKSLV